MTWLDVVEELVREGLQAALDEDVALHLCEMSGWASAWNAAGSHPEIREFITSHRNFPCQPFSRP